MIARALQLALVQASEPPVVVYHGIATIRGIRTAQRGGQETDSVVAYAVKSGVGHLLWCWSLQVSESLASAAPGAIPAQDDTEPQVYAEWLTR